MRTIIGCFAMMTIIAAPALVFACSCAPPPSAKDALQSSSAVFAGKVTAIAAAGKFHRAVTFEIASTWKGTKGKTVTVVTHKDGATCGYGFAKGKSYLVYASQVKEQGKMVLKTNICTRTRLLADAKQDLAELGKSQPEK